MAQRWEAGGALIVELGCLQRVSQNQKRFKPKGSGLGSVGPKVGWASELLGKLKNNNKTKHIPVPTADPHDLRRWD